MQCLKSICIDNDTRLINFLHLFESESWGTNDVAYLWLLTDHSDPDDPTMAEWHQEG